MMSKRSKIYSTDKGAVIIESKTKNKIVELLKEGDKTSSEIREELGKAKSTISVHLSDLKDLGIIDEKVYPKDDRKKIFHLTSRFLARPDIPTDEHYKKLLKNLEKTKMDEYELLKGLFHLVRHGLDSFGLDVHPALKEIGRDAGRSLGKNFSGDRKGDLLEEISYFWKDNRLGTITVEGDDQIVVEDCFDCAGMPEVGHTLCSLDEGFIEGMMEAKLDRKVKVEEVGCHGLGENRCKFIVKLS